MNKRKVGFSHIFRFLDTFSALYNNHYFLIRKKKKKKGEKEWEKLSSSALLQVNLLPAEKNNIAFHIRT